MPDRLADWIALVDACYPERHAESWDAVGLHVGDPADPVTGVLVTLDVTRAVLDEAADRGADLVLAHHPLLFRPLGRLTPATAPGALALAAARRGIAVAAAHTNLDVAHGGTSDPVAHLLGLRDLAPLQPLPRPGAGARVKLVTFVPPQDSDRVLDALASAGAGAIGDYTHCSFRVAGTGTFVPGDTANPAVGQRATLNAVGEDRLEMVVPAVRLAACVAALRAAHPYEEVAFDLHPLLDEPPEEGVGLGRIGTLPQPSSVRALADRIATQLPAPHLRVAGDLDATVSRIAVCGGAGESLIGAAVAAGADAYVTGDLRHHVALDARTLGLTLLDAGHHATEAAALPAFRARLTAAAAERGLGAPVLASAVDTQPWAAWSPPTPRGAL